jgi:glycosyltransferase involved in cell wall biosynthesis
MKVAIVHDWLTGMRGGERMLERVALMWPEAPIHTLVWKRGSVSPVIESHPIVTSFLQRLPGAGRIYRWFLPLFPRAIESFDFRGYDVLISTSHAVAKGAIPPPGAFHFCYIHTPMRYAWDLEDQYFPPGRFPWPLSWFVRRTCARLRAWDVATLDRVHALVTNSRHVADRIHRHYGREAEVIGGPADLSRFAPSADSPGAVPGAAPARGYYLLAGAFAPNKRGDLAVAACRRLGRRLVVVGSGPEERTLRRLAPPGTEFRGWVGDEELPGLYAHARALLFPGEEDLGLMPVESLASGTPVVAFGRGGALETVGRGAGPEALARVAAGGVARVPGGVLFGTQTVAGLAGAIEALERERFDPAALRERALPFAAEEFDRRFRAAFERAHAAWNAGADQALTRDRTTGPGRSRP